MGGKALGVATSQNCSNNIAVPYIAASVTQPVFIAEFPCRVTDIRGRPRVVGSTGAQLTFAKSGSGVTAANGVLLHTGVFDCTATVDVNQTLTLATNPDTVQLQQGDAIMQIVAGTTTGMVGFVSITVEPLS